MDNLFDLHFTNDGNSSGCINEVSTELINLRGKGEGKKQAGRVLSAGSLGEWAGVEERRREKKKKGEQGAFTMKRLIKNRAKAVKRPDRKK